MSRNGETDGGLSATEAAGFSLVWSQIDDKLTGPAWRDALCRRIACVRHRWFHDDNIFAGWCYREVKVYCETGRIPDNGDPAINAAISLHIRNGDACSCNAFAEYYDADWDHNRHYREWRERQQQAWWAHCKKVWAENRIAGRAQYDPVETTDAATGEVVFGRRLRGEVSADKAGREWRSADDERQKANAALTAYPGMGANAERARRVRIGTIEDPRDAKLALEASYGWTTDDDPLNDSANWRRIGDLI